MAAKVKTFNGTFQAPVFQAERIKIRLTSTYHACYQKSDPNCCRCLRRPQRSEGGSNCDPLSAMDHARIRSGRIRSLEGLLKKDLGPSPNRRSVLGCKLQPLVTRKNGRWKTFKKNDPLEEFQILVGGNKPFPDKHCRFWTGFNSEETLQTNLRWVELGSVQARP